MFADDAAAWARYLANDRRFSKVIVGGHSEGALLGLLAMQQVPLAAYISLEGPARPANEILHDQLAKQMPGPLMLESDSTLARLTRGVTVDAMSPTIASIFRPSVQPYMITWFKYSGRTEIARLVVPCLVVQGAHDLQVAPSEADLLLQANPHCQVARIAEMNHVLKRAPADMTGQIPSYRGPDAPLAPGLVDAVSTFVNALAKK